MADAPTGATDRSPSPEGSPGGSTERKSIWSNPFIWAFFIGIITITAIRPFLRHVPEPPPVISELPAYELTDQSGQSFGSVDLAGDVYVANFIFTRCMSICPVLTRSMGQLQSLYDRHSIDQIRLVSFTVDPEWDRPEKLALYAQDHDANTPRWTFLTGETDQMRSLLVDGFKVPMGDKELVNESMIDIAHTGKLVLVDQQGRIRGYYSSDGEGIDEIFHRSQHVLRE